MLSRSTLRFVGCLLLIFGFITATLAQTARRGSGDLARMLKAAEVRSASGAKDTCDSNLNADDEQKLAALKTCIAGLENRGVWQLQKEKYAQLETLTATRAKVEQLNVLHELSNKMRRYDDPVEALKIKQRILDDPAATVNLKVAQHQAMAIDYANVFFDSEKARFHLQAMESINRSRRSELRSEFADLMDATTSGARAAVLLSEGSYDEALKEYGRYIEGYKRFITQIPSLERQFRVDTPDAVRGYIYTGRTYVVETLMRSGQLDAAETQARELLKEQLGILSVESPQLARTLVMYSRVLINLGRFKEAQFFNEKALAYLQRSGIEPEARIFLQAKAVNIDLALSTSQWQAGYQQLIQYRQLKARNGEPPAFEPSWVVIAARAGKPADALSFSTEAWQRAQRNLSAASLQRAEYDAFQAMALSINGRSQEAARLIEMSLPKLLNSLMGSNVQGHEFLRIKLMNLLDGLQGVISNPTVSVSVREPIWMLAETLKFSSVHKAVAASVARSTKDEGLRHLIRTEQDLGLLAQNLAKSIDNIEANASDSQAILDRLREKLANTERTRLQVLQDIQKRFPSYMDLLTGSPTNMQAIAKVLLPGESYVSILPMPNGILVMGVNAQGQEKMFISSLSPGDLKDMVTQVRKTMEFTDKLGSDALPAYRFDLSYKLYQEILAPMASITAGPGLMLASVSGDLASIPLGMLTTKPFTPNKSTVAFASYRQASWLVMEKDIAYAPSATALVSLRTAKSKQVAELPFVGFGDPDFSLTGKPPVDASSMSVRSSQNLERIADQDLLVSDPMPDTIPTIPALPETRQEVTEISLMFGADPQKSLYLGERASRSNALKQDLSRYRVVAFATHGLIPGDVPGLSQPALAMSTRDPSGYLLTSQDILGMKLDAEWVILSACNSGAGDGAGSDALTGLGRSFFYAGSKSIYVTQWPVESESAKQLVTKTLTYYQKEGLGRAVAANKSSRDLLSTGTMRMAGTEFSFAHPAFWAPYIVVGEPGR